VAEALSVRQAGPLGAGLLARLHGSCFARAWDEPVMMQFAASPEVLCLIGSVKDTEAGFFIARKASDEAEILTFGVAPGFRKMGLGRVMLEAAMESLRASGAKRLFFEVEEDNEAALRLYLSFGGKAVGHRKDYYAPGSDAAILSLAL
jgi:[ribosomal protein S18]-alanine N-acetyltransferase